MAQGIYSALIAFCAVLITAWLSVTWKADQAVGDFPVQTIISALFFSGSYLLLASRIPRLLPRRSSHGREYAAIPLTEIGSVSRTSLDVPSKRSDDLPSVQPRSQWYQALLVIGCIILRVEILRTILHNVRCSWSTIETILLPIILVSYHSFTFQSPHDKDSDVDTFSNSIFDDIYDACSTSSLRLLIPTLIMSLGFYLSASHTLHSTYICPISQNMRYYIPFLQIVGACLDSNIIVSIHGILKTSRDDRQRSHIIGVTLTTSAALLSLFGVVWMLFDSGKTTPALDLSPVCLDGILLAVFIVLVLHLGVDVNYSALVVVFTFIATYTPLVVNAWSNRSAFPPQSNASKVVGCFLVFIGFAIVAHLHKSSNASNSTTQLSIRVPAWLWILLTISLLVTEGIFLSRRNQVGYHPINLLMYNSRTNSDRWLTQAASSGSLKRAVSEYTERYGRDPPPNFDKWYEYATERSSVVIDDYDQIHRDLLPFWATDPSHLRYPPAGQEDRKGLVAVTIRDGKAEAHLLGSGETWVSEDTVSIINSFAQWLPDMNIAINVNPEPRVISPWWKINELRKQGQSTKTNIEGSDPKTSTWSSRLDWPAVNESAEDAAVSSTSSSASILWQEIAKSCPPNSRMHRRKFWYDRDFCAHCVYAHSLGQFVSNWTTYTDLCHQYDVGSIHEFLGGFDKSSNFRLTEDVLLPIFSTKKVTGYNDILFPGPQDYIDLSKVPSTERQFSELEDGLFWHGPSGSVSGTVSWQGLQQQRLTHLVNNQTDDSLISILLPSSGPGKYAYQNVPAKELANLIKMDVGITEFVGCTPAECQIQEAELGLTPELPADTKWKYRYLLIMDHDAESQEFISVLGSNSLPLRSSIFRHWYDDRLTPWLHFVPLDMRLHSLHSTLAYFMGLQGNIQGSDIVMPSMEGEAAFVASQGQKWAQKMLRKEDAEVYLFRLLLEWGRVVDDRRTEIGYRYEEQQE